MAISVVNRNKVADAATGNLVATFPSNTLHNAIIVVGVVDGLDTKLTTPTDTAGNTYTLLQTFTRVNSIALKIWANYDCATSVGTNTVTLPDGSSNSIMFIFEVSGLATSGAYDKTSNQGQSSATSLSSLATATLSFANELVLGITANANTASMLPTVGAGYSNLQTTGAAFAWGGSEEKIVASTTAVTATFGLPANSTNERTFVFTFADTAIGGVVNATVTQVAATVTATGGTQVEVADEQPTPGITLGSIYLGEYPADNIGSASIVQVAANLTATGGTPLVQTNANIAQVAANLTTTGGTQTVATQNFVTVAQVAATLTVTGGTQVVTVTRFATVAQVAANLTATGGTQTIATVNNATVAQVHATLTATGGSQTVAAARSISVAQVAANLTVTGGIQTATVANVASATVVQVAARITATGGIQLVIIPPIYNPIVTKVASGSTGSTVVSGRKVTNVDSGAKLEAISSSTKNTSVEGGTKSTTVTSGNKETKT